MLLTKIKLMLNISDTTFDDLLDLLIDICTEQAKRYTHLATISDDIVILMVVESFNQIGAEGIESKEYSGISETPINGYSNKVRSMLNAVRKLRVI